MKKKEDNAKKISVRLDDEASMKLKEAKSKGYTTSQFVNEKVKNSNILDLKSLRNIMISISMIQTQLEFEEDGEIKSNIRGELDKICQSLKLFQSNT